MRRNNLSRLEARVARVAAHVLGFGAGNAVYARIPHTHCLRSKCPLTEVFSIAIFQFCNLCAFSVLDQVPIR
jgi:hypothetical protein